MERIKRAKELLKEDQSIKEVAFGTGFSDTNHFIKTFKTFEGLLQKIINEIYFQNIKLFLKQKTASKIEAVFNIIELTNFSKNFSLQNV
jgi:hypothetical protein